MTTQGTQRLHVDGVRSHVVINIYLYTFNYFETLDAVLASIIDQFDQEGYSVYSKLESILLQKDLSIGAVDEILSLYKDDFSQDLLISYKFFTLSISFHQQMDQFTMLSLWCRVSRLPRRI